MLLERERPPVHHRARVALRVGIARDRDHPEVLAARAVLVHVTARLERVHLRRGHQAHRHAERLTPPDRAPDRAARRARAHARAAEPAELALADRAVTHDDVGRASRPRPAPRGARPRTPSCRRPGTARRSADRAARAPAPFRRGRCARSGRRRARRRRRARGPRPPPRASPPRTRARTRCASAPPAFQYCVSPMPAMLVRSRSGHIAGES